MKVILNLTFSIINTLKFRDAVVDAPDHFDASQVPANIEQVQRAHRAAKMVDQPSQDDLINIVVGNDDGFV